MPTINTFSAVPVSYHQINVSWTASSDAVNFDLDYSLTGLGAWVQILNASAAGLSFNHTPLNPNTTYYYRVRARDAGNVTSSYDFANGQTFIGPPVVSTTSLPNGAVNVAYSETIEITPGTGNGALYFEKSEGMLPYGLSLNALTGEISGTPTSPAIYTFTVVVYDAAQGHGSKTLSIEIAASGSTAALTTPFNENSLTPFHYSHQPKDWEDVISEHKYQDSGRSFNANNTDAPQEWRWIFTGLTNDEANDLEAHYDAAMGRLKDFPYTSRDGVYYPQGTRYKEFERSHEGNKRWVQRVEIVLIRYP